MFMLKGNLIRQLFLFFSTITTIASIYVSEVQDFPFQVAFFFILFTALTTLIIFSLRKFSTLRFVLSTFTLLIAWRIGALYHIPIGLTILYAILFFTKLIYFLFIAHIDIKGIGKWTSGIQSHYIPTIEWQLLFVRLYIGYDLIPHFTEKLFAGHIRMEDVDAFAQLGISHPYIVVIFAGIIEFLGSLSLSCGFFTRIGSIGLFIYIIVAAILGHHFELGFIWASHGGGWEYPVLWAMLILTFSIFAPYKFSVDRFMLNHLTLPKWIKHLIGEANKEVSK